MNAAPLRVTPVPDVAMHWAPSSASARRAFMAMVSTVPSRKVSRGA